MNNQPPQGLERKNINEAIAEAQAKPIEFNPKERAIYVRNMVEKMGDYMDSGKTKEEIAVLEPDFAEKYKNLFDTLTEPGGYNKQSLKTMLALLDRMAEGELNQHQASVIIGQKLSDTYIKPSIE
jgi:hypothetical protein